MNNQNNQYPLGGYNQNQYYQQEMQIGNQQSSQNGFTNVNLNGNMGIEKKGDLGKISIILTILGLFCCGITTIPGIICGIIAFVKDKHNATNIAAMVMATIELAIFGLIILVAGADSISKGVGSANIYQSTKEDAGTLLYDKNDIRVYYNGIDSGDLLSALELKIYVKNDSENNIKIKCDKLTVNGYKMGNYMYLDVDAGLKGSDTVNLYTSDLKNIDASDIKNIDGTFTIENNNTDEVIDTFDFHIE